MEERWLIMGFNRSRNQSSVMCKFSKCFRCSLEMGVSDFIWNDFVVSFLGIKLKTDIVVVVSSLGFRRCGLSLWFVVCLLCKVSEILCLYVRNKIVRSPVGFGNCIYKRNVTCRHKFILQRNVFSWVTYVWYVGSEVAKKKKWKRRICNPLCTIAPFCTHIWITMDVP